MSDTNVNINISDESLKAVKRVVQEAGFTNYIIQVTTGSNKGDNYVGVLYRIKVEGERKGRPDAMHLILKCAPDTEYLRKSVPIAEMFRKEVYAYTKVLPEYKELQQALRSNIKLEFPKCYATSDGIGVELILLQDLRVDGFTMVDKMKDLDLDHAIIVMKAIGRFHALSFVTSLREPVKFEKMAEKLAEDLFKESSSTEDNNEGNNKYWTSAWEKAKFAVRNESYNERFEQFSDSAFKRYTESMKPGKHMVLCHGDCWTNNMLFSYKDGIPNDIRLLDYQIMRYASPSLDVLYFIFLCTTEELRSEHYEELLDIYHNSLSEFLGAFSYDVNHIYSKDEFLLDLKEHSDFGLCSAVMILLFLTSANGDKVPDIASLLSGETSSEDYGHGESRELYDRRMRGVVADYVRYGFL